MKRQYLIKSFLLALLLVLFAAVMMVLSHEVKDGRKTHEQIPPVEDVPVYVECEKGRELEVILVPKENLTVSGLRLLLVNLSGESRGSIQITVKDEAGSLLADQVIPVDTITPGEWVTAAMEMSLAAGQKYWFVLVADESEPYFMQVPLEEAEASLPFTETVIRQGEVLECGISLGINTVTQEAVTFGEIFYFSIPLSVLLLIAGFVVILFDRERVCAWIRKIPVSWFLGKYGNDLFLLLLFGAICIHIYSRAYLKGVYITSDSAGYLREAVNLAEGHGFSYDGLAGYDTWFANWPILYPAMIAAVMRLGGSEAYLASKILTMVMVGLLLLVIRLCFKKNAWFYALCLTNLGFLALCLYTWSEIPFMLFLLLFGLLLAKILTEQEPEIRWYVLLGIAGYLCFLTRYYGIFVWMVTGLYLLLLLINYRKQRDRKLLFKAAGLGAAAFVSGCFSLAYLLMNKLANGMASGVSRSLWWDDYEKLTNDLIESLLVEIFNVFSLQVPRLVEDFPYKMKVLFLAVVFAAAASFIRKSCRRFTLESVLITLAVAYYLIFIGIRYVSSMDTFYFRFFEPGSFLFCMGMAGLVLARLKGKRGFGCFGVAAGAVIFLAVLSVFETGGMDDQNAYYEALVRKWDAAYEEIPEKSVIVFNDIDFRSSYYRPDVVDGMISPEDTFADICERYYGSDYLCIRAEFADTMLKEGEYEESVRRKLLQGLQDRKEGGDFIVVPLGR